MSATARVTATTPERQSIPLSDVLVQTAIADALSSWRGVTHVHDTRFVATWIVTTEFVDELSQLNGRYLTVYLLTSFDEQGKPLITPITVCLQVGSS